MAKKILFFLAMMLLATNFSSAFAEVEQLNLDRESYSLNDSIQIEGTVTNEFSGLVTIVIRDPNNKFVLLSQAPIQPNNTFEKFIQIDSKFQAFGTYNTTAFVLNMTEAKVQSFDVFYESSPIGLSNVDNELENTDIFQENKISESKFEPVQEEPKMEINSLTYDDTNPFVSKKQEIADFVDPTKKPQYYLDRYYNEPIYKSWFDRNYPGLTIEEAIGYEDSKNTGSDGIKGREIIPQAQAASIGSTTQENNSDIAHSALAISGLGILFAAVYGIKKKSEKKSKINFISKKIIRKRMPFLVTRTTPSQIIQNRLAKGEITVEEYERIREKLDSFC